jgi:hypothetical protein
MTLHPIRSAAKALRLRDWLLVVAGDLDNTDIYEAGSKIGQSGSPIFELKHREVDTE